MPASSPPWSHGDDPFQHLVHIQHRTLRAIFGKPEVRILSEVNVLNPNAASEAVGENEALSSSTIPTRSGEQVKVGGID